MISTTNLYAILSTLYSKYEAKNTLPDWFAMNLKTLLSKNITIQDWNTLQLYLKNVIGESQAIYEFCQDLIKEIAKLDDYINKDLLDYINGAYSKIATIESYIPEDTSVDNKLMNASKFQNFATTDDLKDYTPLTKFEELVKVVPTDIAINANNELYLEHDGTEITGQTKKVKVATLNDLNNKVSKISVTTTPGSIVYGRNSEGVEESVKYRSGYSYGNDLIYRDSSGNAEVGDPTAPLHIANKRYVDAKMVNVYTFKGSVDTYNDLPTNANNGDVYDIKKAYESYPAGTNFAWTGEKWDALGGSVDLSNYVTKTELTTALKDYVTTTALNTKLNDYVTSTALTELLKSYTTTTAFNNHVNDKSNPHKVTKTQVGLGNVDNTSDKNKPVSTAQQTAIDNTGHELNIVGNEIQLLGANNQVLSRQTLPQTEIEYATDDEIRALFN